MCESGALMAVVCQPLGPRSDALTCNKRPAGYGNLAQRSSAKAAHGQRIFVGQFGGLEFLWFLRPSQIFPLTGYLSTNITGCVHTLRGLYAVTAFCGFSR